ncbi:hypothetical protein [Dyella sp. 20L07]|uniref:hypothetical protein n=1 Tax=Dyella sp. 20L07 TaxID=3384240 RepID=UPI003D2A31C5
MPMIVVVPYSTILGSYQMHVGSWDFSAPRNYHSPIFDEMRQLQLTESVLDNGWVLQNRLDESSEIKLGFSMSKIREHVLPPGGGKPVLARFALLQEENACSDTIECKVQVFQ